MTNSFLSKISKKKLIVPIRIMNGKISNKTDNEFRKVKKMGNIKLTSLFLKKVISSRIFKIKTKHKKKILTINMFFKNTEIINLLYDEIIFCYFHN